MNKSAFRPRSLPSPAYPDLPSFDRGRRAFLAELGAALGGALLLLSGSADAAGQGEDRKKKDTKKKKKEGDNPRPPVPGGKGHLASRTDDLEDEAWAEHGAAPSTDQKPEKPEQKKQPRKKREPKRPPPRRGGVMPHPAARIDEQAEEDL